MRHLIATSIVLLAASAGAAPRRLDPKLGGWLPENRARLDAFLATPKTGRSVATLDWDNTMMRNDIGDLTMAWMLRHDALLRPADWRQTSGALTPAAIASLKDACSGRAGARLPTAKDTGCADAIWSIYSDGKTAAGAPAWSRERTLTTHQSYAWLARLLAGRTPAEAAGFARAAYREGAAAPVGALQTVGTRGDVPAWVRLYEPMKDLAGALAANGHEVWIVSASPQAFVEVVAREAGLSRVIGVRGVVRGGRYTGELESCGDAPANSLIPFDRGKRCWINKVIFGLPAAQRRGRAPSSTRQRFAAGDSDTDIAFLQDATELKLTIDRNKIQLQCNAYAHGWLVQPMFIEPLPRRTEPYPCATATDAEGAIILDEHGRPMADQLAR